MTTITRSEGAPSNGRNTINIKLFGTFQFSHLMRFLQ